MKKTICATLLVASFALGNANASTLTLSNFGSTVASDGGWTYNATTSSITGPQAPAALLFPDPQPSSPFNLLTVGSVSDLKLRLTMNVTTSPSGGFTVSLEDNATPTAKQISTNFDWSAFTIGQSTAVEVALGADPGGFNYSSVVNWNLNSGNNGNQMSVNVTSLQVVPEPSTYALMALSGLVLFFIARRRKAQQV